MSGTLSVLVYDFLVRSILRAVPPSLGCLGVFADDLGLAIRRRFEAMFALEPIFVVFASRSVAPPWLLVDRFQLALFVHPLTRIDTLRT